MSSRLDRLFILLETGSSSATRKAAASQLGEVQKNHPGELHNLLRRLHTFLSSSSWDTRIAASHALEAILKNVTTWKPNWEDAIKDEDDIKTEDAFIQEGRLNFNMFDLEKVIRNGEELMASEAKVFDEDKMAAMNSKEKLAWQRLQLNKKLGLSDAMNISLDLFSNEDLFTEETEIQEKGHQEQRLKAADILANEIQALNERENLSSREINRLKRKAKLEAKASKSKPDGNFSDEETSAPKKMKVESVLVAQPGSDVMVMDSVPVASGGWEDSKDWPLDSFCNQLVSNLFSARWEVRHGAATALKSLIRIQGESGGMTSRYEIEQQDHLHSDWLEDLALRLICVLALDKFGDFVSDQVVAPVRESSAQALGSVFQLMSNQSLSGCVHLLLQLLQQSEWQCRHGGLLAVKYLLATRGDVAADLLPRLFPAVAAGLEDGEDDVVAVAASALLPVTSVIIAYLPHSVSGLADRLWEAMLELDDLTSSTQSIMALLADLLSQPRGVDLAVGLSKSGNSLPTLVPRLFPFLSHSSSHVRKAALETLLTLSSHPSTAMQWLAVCAGDILRHLYQRALLEHQLPCLALVPKVWNSICENTPLEPLLMASCPWFGPWIKLISFPGNQQLDSNILLPTIHGEKSRQFLGGPEAEPITDSTEKDKCITRARCLAAKLLGKLTAFIVRPVPGIVYTSDMESPLEMLLSKILIPQLTTTSAYQKLSVSLIIIQWLEQTEPPESLHETALASTTFNCLTDNIFYDEISNQMAKLRSEAGDYIASLRHYKLPVDEAIQQGAPLSPENIQFLLGPLTDQLIARVKLKPKVLETIQDRKQSVVSTYETTMSQQASLGVITMASLAGALSCLGNRALPERLNPVIKPLMESIKKEVKEEFQLTAANSLAKVLDSCASREVSPNDKVVKNLCSFACSNREKTPPVDLANLNGHVDPCQGILTLYLQEKLAERGSKSKGRKKRDLANKGLKAVNEVSRDAANSIVDPLQGLSDVDSEEQQKSVETQCRGASFALKSIARHFGSELPHRMPKLWELSLLSISGQAVLTNLQDLVNALQVLQIILPDMSQSLHPELLYLIPHLLNMVGHNSTVVRYMSATCLSEMAKFLPVQIMSSVVEVLVPQLDDSVPTERRQGAVETISMLSETLGISMVPYIVLMVVPILGRMSDMDSLVRPLATNTFASLVRLMPLEGGVPEPQGLSSELKMKKEKEKKFLEQLLNSKSAESYRVSVPVAADLRSYQVAGVNWLGFLNKYKLHGILCDDMGLGKTLQSICMLASDHHNRATSGQAGLQSLVVCPATLGGHWLEEVNKFVERQYLDPFLYFGPPGARNALKSQVPQHNLIITSYDIVRNDIDFFGSIKWNYLILDEGHIIKNSKTKTAVAIRQLVATHRLILSGTPIQNGVLELWALFDFLMPGYLGTEKQFSYKYSRPIVNSRDPKCSAKDQEAGALAMEALHRQSLPFILRRMKEDVLADLPPKITQDYYCDLSPLQTQLYEDFTRSQAQQAATAAEQGGAGGNTHVFQALQYLRKLCNHPKLVLHPSHPEYQTVLASSLGGQPENISNIDHAAKLPALKQLLLDLGIGVEATDLSVVSQHRALVFCQLKTMLDIVENDLLRCHLPSVTYLRLDGSVPASKRHALVSSFNNDPSIDLLLLSTSVGGLGLNLTGADTVIFVEHDWNPMKDLQAMDRAHRIGQRRVVNVYRLITRNTLEEKIMSLQKFKIDTAQTVITTENSSLQSMGTDQVLDLFSLDQTKNGKSEEAGVKNVLDNLPELWDDSQYTEEYDMSNYISTLNKS